MAGQTMDEIITKNCSGSSRNSSQVMYGYTSRSLEIVSQKHYARDNNKVEELREPEKECKASGKDDWQIDMPDEDEINDIEEASTVG